MNRTWAAGPGIGQVSPSRSLDRTFSALLLASTVLGGSALAAYPASAAPAADVSGGATVGELVVTAEKREENIQSVPMSIQALDTRTLSKLNITNFQDYVKFMPSVSFQTFGPSQTSIYMRGVASGDNANHSGPLPSVGSYLDEQPITTIGGTLDVHIYDIARIEVLPGPQGTLYGASSESGTMRIITNQPNTNGFAAGYDLQGNFVDHGAAGYIAEGFINVPVTPQLAVRLVGFYERDGGFIDNVLGTRPFAVGGGTISNQGMTRNDFNPVETYGGRASLKFDLNENWSITPTVIAQDMRAPGIDAYNPAVGDLEVQRFQPDSFHDRWIQAALTINGKIDGWDLTYSGGYFNRKVDSLSDYTDYSVAYDAYDRHNHYNDYWYDKNGNQLPTPAQEIIGRDRFEKGSNELRIASPATNRFRVIAGLFQERQTHWIVQDYQIQGFGSALNLQGVYAPPDDPKERLPGPVLPGLTSLDVPGWANTLWLTDQNRIDRDEAAFGEASFDITPQLTLTGGIRYYHYNNTLVGFYGFSSAFDYLTGFGYHPEQDPPRFGTGGGYNVVNGQLIFNYNCIPGESFRDAPCVNLNKSVAASGETHKVNLTYKISPDALVYFTYSTGYRPGGVNRSGSFGPYAADTLANYEVGWKTSWFDRSLVFNGALYDEEWSNFQFSFLGPNSLTIIQNAPSARILGIETSLDWHANQHITLSGGFSYNDAKLTADFCTDANGVPQSNCAGLPIEAPKGQQLPFTPAFKGDLTGRYTWDFAGWDAFLQASVLVQSKVYAALRPADTELLGIMPGYATADFSVGAQRDRTTVELFIKNAFDTRGQINRYTPCTTAICAQSYPLLGIPAAVYIVPIQPLTVGIKIGQRF